MYLVAVADVAILDVVPLVQYLGDAPMMPLADATAAGFMLNVTLHLMAERSVRGTLSLAGEWGDSVHRDVALPAGLSALSLTLKTTAGAVQLWWPHGLGAQRLYNVSVDLNLNGTAPVRDSRRIGFRVFHLVTTNASEHVASTDGSDDFSMFFRVNGASVFSRGANVVPMEGLEGRISADAYIRLVRSAVDANMNTLRVWGGSCSFMRCNGTAHNRFEVANVSCRWGVHA